MAGWAEAKRKALAQVHRTFERPAVYLSHAAGSPLPILMRLHRKPIVENPELGNSALASIMDMQDRIVFDAAVVPDPRRDGYVIYKPPGDPVEGYMIGPSAVTREGYIRVEVTPMSTKDIATLLASQDLTLPAWEALVE